MLYANPKIVSNLKDNFTKQKHKPYRGMKNKKKRKTERIKIDMNNREERAFVQLTFIVSYANIDR